MQLTNVLNHSESLSTDRRAATDYSVGALIKVYMNPAYQDLAYPIITSTSPTFNGSYSLVELLSKWFQFDDDDIQSFTIVNMWVQVILDKDLPHPLAEMSAYNMRLLKEDKVGALLCIAV